MIETALYNRGDVLSRGQFVVKCYTQACDLGGLLSADNPQ